MTRYLVVANQTLGGVALAEVIRQKMVEGDCSFHVIVPATKPGDHLVWTEGEAHLIARERLDRALAWFKSHGAEATGDVGDANPMLAIGDALIAGRFDEIILSTLPAGVSRWLNQDLPSRARRRFGLVVTHVVGEPLPVPRSA